MRPVLYTSLRDAKDVTSVMPDTVFYQVSDMEVWVPPQIKAREARLSPRYLLMMSADLDYNFSMRLLGFTAGVATVCDELDEVGGMMALEDEDVLETVADGEIWLFGALELEVGAEDGPVEEAC